MELVDLLYFQVRELARMSFQLRKGQITTQDFIYGVEETVGKMLEALEGR